MSARTTTLGTMLAAAALTIGPGVMDLRPVFIWNASASVPIGLYRVEPEGRPAVPDLVAVMPPEPISAFLADGGYLPRGVPLLKRVVGLPGQTVCRNHLTILIDGVPMTVARKRDRRGRLLPVWQGCHVIEEGEVFLMNWQTVDSLDGRYFGPLPTASILGRAVPLWTFEER
jgi:conjugative transfer signal peptidase TraF